MTEGQYQYLTIEQPRPAPDFLIDCLMFVSSEKFIEAHGSKLRDIFIYGQESNSCCPSSSPASCASPTPRANAERLVIVAGV